MMFVYDTRTNARKAFCRGLITGAAIMLAVISTASWAVYGQNSAVSDYINKQADLYGMLKTLEEPK